MNTDKFKFRAWDGTHMHYFTFDDVHNGCLIVDQSEDCAYERTLLLSDCEITQSTGERDKDGKLIFDGDIVVDIYGNAMESDCCVYRCELEILGNKFQHPEILKK